MWSNTLYLSIHLGGDIARSMGTRSKFSHRKHIFLLDRGEPVEPNPEKTLVQSAKGKPRNFRNAG